MMGTARLKIKTEMNYRPGYTSRSCNNCNHFRSQACPDDTQPARCEIIGLKEGRLYRINPKNICDRHDASRYLARLRGW